MAEFTLRIDGMHCGSCVRRVTQALNSAGSVEVEEVRIGAARLKSLRRQCLLWMPRLLLWPRPGYTARLEQ